MLCDGGANTECFMFSGNEYEESWPEYFIGNV